MADIIHEFPINAPAEKVFALFSTPKGLDRWWTKSSAGNAAENAEYKLFFGPGYDWRAKVTRCVPPSAFELLMTDVHEDWKGTRVGCQLTPDGASTTRVRFYHTGWPEANEHWRVSCYCWAMYLRIMKRNLEHGEFVPYERRLDV